MMSLPEGPIACRVSTLRGIALTLSMICAVLLLASPMSAQVSRALPGKTKDVTAQTPVAAVARSAAPAQAATQPDRRGEHEGITVHGRWVIEVRNPDGTVTSRREFENSLQPAGAFLWAGLGTGLIVPGSWTILLNGNGNAATNDNTDPGTAPGPCLPIKFRIGSVNTSGGPSTGGTCVLTVAPNASGDGSYWPIACANDTSGDSPEPCSLNLTVTGPSTVSTVTLSGSVPVTATSAGTINDVETTLSECSAVGSNAGIATPANCAAVLNSQGQPVVNFTSSPTEVTPPVVTEATLGQNGAPAPIAYNPGQTIAVTVALSFQ